MLLELPQFGLLQIPVARRNDADIHRARPVLAHPFVLFLLQHAQKLALQRQRNLRNLVQQQRPPIRRFKPARPVFNRAGERSSCVAEKLALVELARHRSAIHANQRVLAPPAAAVDFPRHQFLAGARFAQNQHCRVGRRHHLDLPQQVRHHRVLPDDVPQRSCFPHLFLQVAVLQFQMRPQSLDFLESPRIHNRPPDFIRKNAQPGRAFLRRWRVGEHRQHPENLVLELDRLHVEPANLLPRRPLIPPQPRRIP